jgi:tryptophan synthase alpha chain
MRTSAFAAYFLAGYPDIPLSLEYMSRCAREGVDIFEIGYPSADPFFDGDLIRNAHGQVLSRGMPDIDYWKRLRSCLDKPVWIMAYKSDFIDTGVYREFAEQGLADILVLPDCNDEDRRKIQGELKSWGVGVMGFANTAMPLNYFIKIVETYRTVYFQRYMGKTGSVPEETGDASDYLKTAAAYPDRKIYAGFGIRTAEKTRQLISQGFDGVIIGTALLEALEESEEAMLGFIREIAGAVKN